MEPAAQPRVNIIVLNYRGVEDTIALLENLKAVDYENLHVVVIDNASNDGSSDRLNALKFNYPAWTFIFNDKNLGFAGGCNQGIRLSLDASADFVLLLNNDTLVEPDFLQPLVDLSMKHNALTGGLIFYNSSGMKKVWSFGGNLTWGAVPGHLAHLNEIQKPPGLPQEQKTDWIPGCCLLIHRRVIEKIGYLDEDYFAYVEDVDFCLRAHKAGFPSYVTSKSLIFHKVGRATGGGYSPAGRRMIAESSVIFIRKHGDLGKRLRFIVLFWIGIVVASVREGIRGNFVAVKEKVDGYKSGWLKHLKD